MSERAETGTMRFGTDWTGVFIRGDNAFYYAMRLRGLIARGKTADVNMVTCRVVEGLCELLESSHEGRMPKPQEMLPFEEAKKKP